MVTQNKNWSRILREGFYNFSSLIPLDNELRHSIVSFLRWVWTNNKSDGKKAIIECKMNNDTSMNNEKK